MIGFRNAFPLMTQKLGIVYTPVEVVDFIIHSVEGVMKRNLKHLLQMTEFIFLILLQAQELLYLDFYNQE